MTPASHPGPWINSDPPLAPGPRQRAGQAEGCHGTCCNRGVSRGMCQGQLDTWSGAKSAGPLAVGVETHSPGEAAAPRGPRRRVRGSVRRGWGQGARAGSRDTEETVWGWGRGQSCCPGLRGGERTVQGWGGRDSPGWVLGAMDAVSQEAWGPSACPPPGRASMAVGRPHHASCDGGAEGQDTGDAGVGHS